MNVSAAKDGRGVGKEGKHKSVYCAGRFWKALRALEKQVNPAPWLLYGTDVIWLCTKASAFSSFVQLPNDITPKHKKVPLCCGPSPAGSRYTSHSRRVSLPYPETLLQSPRWMQGTSVGSAEPFGSLQASAGCGRSKEFHSNCVQHALHFSNPQWGLCSPLQLPHNAVKPECCRLMTQARQLGQFNYFQGWNPFGGVYNTTQFNLVTVHNCC